MNINKIIDKISNYNIYEGPKYIKMIVGKEYRDLKQQSEYEELKEIEIYKIFGHCAFIIQNLHSSKNGFEKNVWSLLLGTNLQEKILDEIKN